MTNWRELLSAATQIDRLSLGTKGLIRRVRNGERALIESHHLGLKGHGQSATAARRQTKRAVIRLGVVAAHSHPAGEGDGHRFWVAPIVTCRTLLRTLR